MLRLLALAGQEEASKGLSTELINSMSSCRDDLRHGLRVSDKSGCEILYRYLTPTDDVEAITRLLHDAYEARGYRFVERCQWEVTDYRSMVFAKCLGKEMPQPSEADK